MEPKTPLMSGHVIDTVARATPVKREGRKSMTRRSGQSGYIEVRGKYYVVRFWKDVVGQEKRMHASEKVCPISGPGHLTKSERERKAKEIIAESGADTPEYLAHAEGISSGVSFREQTAWWIKHVQQRKRKPIAPATVEPWRCAPIVCRESRSQRARRKNGQGWPFTQDGQYLHTGREVGRGFCR